MSAPEPQRVTIDDLLEFMGDRALGRSKFTSTVVNRLAPLSPGKSGALSFAQGSSPQRLAAVLSCRSSVILVEDTTLDEVGESATAVLVAVVDPRLEFALVASHFFTQNPSRDMAPSAVIAESAVVGRDSTIGPGAYVAPGVVIGDCCRLGANSVLLEGTVLGDHTSVGPNSTIGNTGFGYARDEHGTPVLVPHYGGVRIGSHVDIGANTCIDRGTLEDTIVEDHVKIDNLVHIAHNCKIREGALIIATAILSGGVEVGARAWVAPNAAVREQLRIGADAKVGLGSTVIRDVPDGAVVVGSPARELTR